MRRRTLLSLAATTLAAPRALAGAPPDAVDVLLLLAVDTSRSMDEEEARLQRDGHVEALRNSAVQEAIGNGPAGAIGLAYLEWSGAAEQVLRMPWTCIDSPRAATRFADALHAAPLGIGSWTALGAALDRARDVVASAPFAAPRRVVDVSGDGVNNSGPSAEGARDRAVAAGLVINGLPVMSEDSTWHPLTGGSQPLDAYYRERVVGGPGAFVLPAEGFRAFAVAVRRKLVLEIAGRTLEHPGFA